MSEHQEKLPTPEDLKDINKARAAHVAKIIGADKEEVFTYLTIINEILAGQSGNSYLLQCLNDTVYFELSPFPDEHDFMEQYKQLLQIGLPEKKDIEAKEIPEMTMENIIPELRAVALLLKHYRGKNPANIVKWRFLFDLLESFEVENKHLPLKLLTNISIDSLKDLEGTDIVGGTNNVFQDLIRHYINQFKKMSEEYEFWEDLYRQIISDLETMQRPVRENDSASIKKLFLIVQNDINDIANKLEKNLEEMDYEEMVGTSRQTELADRFSESAGKNKIPDNALFTMNPADQKRLMEIMGENPDRKDQTPPEIANKISELAKFLDWLVSEYKNPMDFIDEVLNLKNGEIPVKSSLLQ